MSEVDFTEILGKQVGSAPQPKPLPPGTYFGTLSGKPKPMMRKTKEGEKPILNIVIALSEAGEDVDEDSLSEAGGLRKKDGSAKTLTQTFWLTEEAMFIFDRFMESMGYTADSNKTYLEVLPELEGKDVTLAVKQRSYESNGRTTTVSEIDRIFATGE